MGCKPCVGSNNSNNKLNSVDIDRVTSEAPKNTFYQITEDKLKTNLIILISRLGDKWQPVFWLLNAP